MRDANLLSCLAKLNDCNKFRPLWRLWNTLIYKSGRGVGRGDLQNLCCWRRCRCTRYAFGRPTADHVKRSLSRGYVELGFADSERLCHPSKVGPYSVHALHEICPRDAKAKSDDIVIPAVYYPPLQ